MQVDLLFTGDDYIKIKKIKNLLTGLAGVTLDRDKINYRGAQIQYELKQSSYKKYVNLSLILEGNNKRIASILSDLKYLIIKGEHRALYKIIVSYDETSMYMNKKLFPFLSENENKIRQLIYLILIDVLGTNWVFETLNDEQLEEMKGTLRGNDKTIIEKGLEAFSYQEYISFLFDKRPNNFCKEEFLSETIEKIKVANDIDKEKLLSFFLDNKGCSLWEKYFSNIEYKNPRNDITEIRDIRNGVMHNKEISLEDFESHSKILRKSNKGLTEAIEYVKSSQIGEFKIEDVALALTKTIEDTRSQCSSMLEPMRKALEDLAKEAYDMQKNFDVIRIDFPVDGFIEANNMALKISEVYKNSGIVEYLDSISQIEKAYANLIPDIKIPKINVPRMYFNPELINFPNLVNINQIFGEDVNSDEIDKEDVKNSTNETYNADE